MTPKELNAIAAKLAEQVTNLRRKQADIVPPGWVTARQIAEASGKHIGTVIDHFKAVGAEKRKFLINCKSSLQFVQHYRLK